MYRLLYGLSHDFIKSNKYLIDTYSIIKKPHEKNLRFLPSLQA